MVRLKAVLQFEAREPYGISIPYGSIKRKQTASAVRSTSISIPYGSIKSIFLPRGYFTN